MLNLKIGGVPEHFNYPWYLCLKDKSFTKSNINLRWVDYHGGTGEMCEALRAGTVDIAIVLTEGIIKDISLGNPSKILQTYVESPLIWGIHTDGKSDYKSISELENKVVAISRYGSGSHLMAIVNAMNLGWEIDKLRFEVVNNLEGGIKALNDGRADYFMWERFTTKPLVDKGIFNRIHNCPTPWPCFVIAARDEVIENYPTALKEILNIITTKLRNFKNIDHIDELLANRYQQQTNDIQEWLDMTKWNTDQGIDETFISRVQHKMLDLKVIENIKNPSYFIKNLYF